ncbi:hypothetical protein BJY04DRAFT_225286, partial [Aspergillus karnatakaensis]|uniref:uncharacterized protein n=1 Tax=Aspergillus karnatakaensis TaxID=1810916 RepID=UPI003CCCF513
MRPPDIWLRASALLAALPLASTTPTPFHVTSTADVHLERREDIGVPLRIMPLGDSITYGISSSNGNGYRGPLANLLSGTSVDFVGSHRSGSMQDSDNEGHSGALLSEIASYALRSVAARPNVVLVHAGTNDMDRNRETAGAPARLRNLLDVVRDKCPDAVIIVAQIVGMSNRNTQIRTTRFNEAVFDLVKQRREGGEHIILVDMSDIRGRDLADGLHPNDGGYSKMANAWLGGIKLAKENGWLKGPVQSNAVGVGLGTGGSGSGSCSGADWIQEGKVADFFGSWWGIGEVASGVPSFSQDKLFFADIDGDGKDDYLVVDSDSSVRAWLNTGNIPNAGKGENWIDLGKIATGVEEEGSKVQFADIDGDGLADYLVVYNTGAVKAWRNVRNDGGDWMPMGSIASGVGEPGSSVRFGDINGDGFDDYLILTSGGVVKAWRNPGNLFDGSGKQAWVSLGTIATGVGVSGSRVRLEDFDGDGLLDYMVLGDGGRIEGYRNNGRLQNNAANYDAVGTIASGVPEASLESLKFGDLDGDGMVDYLVVSSGGAVSAWLNTGKIGRISDNIRFADLNGDGRYDLVHVDSKGAVEAWLNEGGLPTKWRSLGTIASGVPDASPEKIHFADMDGDGLDDYILVLNNGAAKCWRNTGELRNGGTNWIDLGTVATGTGASGDKIRFADVNRDGIADYLAVRDNGAVDAYLGTGNVVNNGENWNPVGIIASGVAPGKNIQFGDINGDGLDDYLVVWDNGRVEAWLHTGHLESISDHVGWRGIGVIATGVPNQGRVIFADLTGDGKDDYLNVRSSGAVDLWRNHCAEKGSGGGGGDPPGPPGPVNPPDGGGGGGGGGG